MKPTELAAVVGVIDPDANAAGTHSTGWASLRTFASVLGIIQAGTLGSGGTVDAKLEQATDASGTGAKDISGKAITQMAASDKQALVQCRGDELDGEGGFTHVRLTMVVGTATSDCSALLLGFMPDGVAAADHDAATVDEIVG
jgi:hypothetical protein